MKKTSILAFVILLLTWGAKPAQAETPRTLSSHFEQTIWQADQIMRDPGLSEALKGAQLQDFNPEFTTQASFGISDVLQITVAPEIDLVFVPTDDPLKP
ncbi:MAG: hypothetical protein P4M08_09445 [Oligoflexia bacterium]|nr:hypothetical protein [Oligoflexia bacterium]